jgi:hypothetical protein
MADGSPTRLPQPIILVRGFGGFGIEDEKRIAYQGFNDGTVYPQKRGENYIYEGLVLRFMKSRWQYQDATNVVGYYGKEISDKAEIPKELEDLDSSFFTGAKVVIDPAMALALVNSKTVDPLQTLWVFRYYDLSDRVFSTYGKALVRLIDFIQALAKLKNRVVPKVNIIAHSMGGLIVREAIQSTYPAGDRKAENYINKVVTLGTPHQGISFQLLQHWIKVDAGDELEHFNTEFQKDKTKKTAYVNFSNRFPPARILTVVGTNYRTYEVGASSLLNRVFSLPEEFGANYNRSDGLVQQDSAQLPNAPRTFVHKCHGGPDSLVTSREAFEVATRFFFGNILVRLHLVKAEVVRGFDRFGRSEIFFGVSIKPRGVDFDLFHQSAEAENCYGPFHTKDLSDEKLSFDWAGNNRLIWEGWLDTTARVTPTDRGTNSPVDVVMRLDFYVGERDLFGLGFSDTVIFRKQYYVRAILEPELRLQSYDSEAFIVGAEGEPMTETGNGWEFNVKGTGFKGTLQVSFATVPEVG